MKMKNMLKKGYTYKKSKSSVIGNKNNTKSELFKSSDMLKTFISNFEISVSQMKTKPKFILGTDPSYKNMQFQELKNRMLKSTDNFFSIKSPQLQGSQSMHQYFDN